MTPCTDMAKAQFTILPIPTPDTALVSIPGGDPVEVPIEDLDDEAIGDLISEFTQEMIAKVEKKRESKIKNSTRP